MRIFLAGNIALDVPTDFIKFKAPFVLQTFWDLHKTDGELTKQVLQSSRMFFLDSGAFTFMNSGKKVDWWEYAKKYAKFINDFDIKYYFNLDLDTIIGIQETQKLTDFLESETGKKSIPVFHKCQGVKHWREICEEYDYVAIGASGLTAECKWVKNDKLLNQMIRIAHQSGAEVHGLGYTRLSNINDTTVDFDSVDSTSCLSGGRFGTVYKFTGNKLITKQCKGRLKDYKSVNSHNVEEWVKMANYKKVNV